MQCRKDKQKTAKQIENWTNKHPRRVSHERGFRILKCIWVGPWLGPLGSKTPPPTWPQDASKPRCLAHLCAIWSDLSSIRGAYFRKMFAAVLLIGVRSGMHFVQPNFGTLEMKQTSGLARSHILGTVAGLLKALG